MKNLKDIIKENLVNEKLIINKDIKISERTPQNKGEEACKVLANICKKTIFKGINLNEKDIKENGKLCKIDKAFNIDGKYAQNFYNERASILNFNIHTTDSKKLKSIELTGNFPDVFVAVHLNDNEEIDNIILTSNLKDWLI